MNKKSLLAILLVAGLFLLAGCDENTATPVDKVGSALTAGKTYKIGVIGPLSGEANAYGQEEKMVLDYRVAELNKQNNYQIELEWEDGKCDAVAAAAAFRKMTETDGVKFIIGGICSAETLAMAPLTKDTNALVISAMSSNPDIEGKSPRLMTLSYSDTLVGDGLAAELAKYKKVALISERTDFNSGLRMVVENTMASKYKDVKIVANEQFDKDSTNFKDILDKVKASGAEAILLNPNAGNSASELIKQVAEAGLNAKLIGQVAFNSLQVLAQAPDLINGMVIIDAPAITDQKFLNYRDKMIKDKGVLDNLSPYYTAATIDAVDLLSKLISDNNGDVDSVQKALSTGIFTGNVGRINFSGKNFVQGVTTAKYLVTNRKAVKQ